MNPLMIQNRLDKIESIAGVYGWEKIDYQENIFLIRYSYKGNKINVYLSTLTVSTCINHPKKGKTQLFRKNLSYKEIEKIFQNPRVHTGHGYYTKRK